jgi:anti-sigma factor RsiW
MDLYCRQAQEELVAYLAGDLSGAESSRMEIHLGGCAGCREALALERGLRGLGEACPAPSVPPAWASQVVAAWETDPDPRLRSLWSGFGVAISRFTVQTLVDPLSWMEEQFQQAFRSLGRQLMWPLKVVAAPLAGVADDVTGPIADSLSTTYRLVAAPLAGGTAVHKEASP